MSSKVPRKLVDAYADALNVVSARAKDELALMLEAVDMTRPVAEVRNALIEIMQPYCRAAAEASSAVAAEFYESVRALEYDELYQAVAGDFGYSDRDLERVVRGSVQQLVDEGELGADAVKHDMKKTVGFQVKKSAGTTIAANGKRDSKRVRYARVPRPTMTYANGCPFCQMLAHKGFVYSTAETAGEGAHYHDGCNCMVVPGFGSKPRVEGYDIEDYAEGSAEWKRGNHTEAAKQHAVNQRERRSGRR